MSSDDTGKDEANVQTLLKKHKEISDELKNYESTIKALHDQADALGEDDRESRTVTERLNSIDKRYDNNNLFKRFQSLISFDKRDLCAINEAIIQSKLEKLWN